MAGKRPPDDLRTLKKQLRKTTPEKRRLLNEHVSQNGPQKWPKIVPKLWKHGLDKKAATNNKQITKDRFFFKMAYVPQI